MIPTMTTTTAKRHHAGDNRIHMLWGVVEGNLRLAQSLCTHVIVMSHSPMGVVSWCMIVFQIWIICLHKDHGLLTLAEVAAAAR
jgi:hypothetical protein